MTKRILLSSALLSTFATAHTFAATPIPPGGSGQNGLFGMSPWVWVIIAVVVVAGGFFLLKGKKK